MRNLKRILVCPNAFKGSRSAIEAAQAISTGVLRGCEGRRIEIDSLPLSDGGDSFLDTMLALSGGVRHRTQACDPLGRRREAEWGSLGGESEGTAVIEMALASGLALLSPNERDPMRATSFGTGELILEAIRTGHRRLIIGIGGSATNDGGAGAMQALGAKLLDRSGKEPPVGAAYLPDLNGIDLSGFLVPKGFEIVVACDVTNPLCGPEGATAVYGPQKGVTPEMIPVLDAALGHFAETMKRDLGADVANTPGAGAAGGLGAALMGFCGATLRSGIDLILEVSRFDARLKSCQLVLTGEGKLDSQTAQGKVIAGVAKRAKAAGIPVVAFAGSVDSEAEVALRALGVTAAFSLCDHPMSVEEAMKDADRLLSNAAERVIRVLGVCSP